MNTTPPIIWILIILTALNLLLICYVIPVTLPETTTKVNYGELKNIPDSSVTTKYAEKYAKNRGEN